jgi:hypothetical protein
VSFTSGRIVVRGQLVSRGKAPRYYQVNAVNAAVLATRSRSRLCTVA